MYMVKKGPKGMRQSVNCLSYVAELDMLMPNALRTSEIDRGGSVKCPKCSVVS